MSLKKIDRNKQLYKLRKSNPKKWNFLELAKHYNISAPTAHEIYHREKKNRGVDK